MTKLVTIIVFIWFVHNSCLINNTIFFFIATLQGCNLVLVTHSSYARGSLLKGIFAIFSTSRLGKPNSSTILPSTR